ncbi:MAG: thiamine pyrophosphate-dependent enzyme [Arenicellales bacterium]|nr:thiamine pyrophosphate-dependent enzyme [Arenicellales bacterium]
MSNYNRALVVEKNFVQCVLQHNFPEPLSPTNWSDTDLDKESVVDLFESQLISRHLDFAARKLRAENKGYYTIGSAGHEGNAVLGKIFRITDMAFLHYRSGGFMAARSKLLPGSNFIHDTLLSLVASCDDPIAGGRHKVWGSLPLLVPPQTSTIASHLPKAVGAALSIDKAHDLGIPSVMPKDALVLCSFGDASMNHSTALGALNTALWTAYQNIPMPIVFICEDNRIGISVPTPVQWLESQYAHRNELEYIAVDGLNLFDLYVKGNQAQRYARSHRNPVFLHMKTVRLLGHAGSDVEQSYLTLREIERAEWQDPVLHSARLVIDNAIMSPAEVVDLYEDVAQRVDKESRQVIHKPKLQTAEQVRSTLTACSRPRTAPPLPSLQQRQQLFAADFDKLQTPQHMAKLINWGLHDILLRYKNTLVFGEDVAQKGGVYNVTDGLYRKFGAKRVFNSPLDEQSILGSAIGLAHNGFVPIPEIQFLAYIHNAEDQIRGEAATLAFFSQGQFNNPMVVRIAGLAYQKGFGGHFHNDNSLSVLRDIPGVIVAIPSNGDDAVRMLRTCVREAYENGRVCIFIEPIALYMTKDLHTADDRGWSFTYPTPHEEIAPGEFKVYGSGKELVILTYGNGLYYARQAQYELEKHYSLNARVIDLRWMAPIDQARLMQQIHQAKHILIVDECRKTGSWSEALVTMLVEHSETLLNIKVIAADDCFISLGEAATAGLPDKNDIITGAIELVRKHPTSGSQRL